MALSQFYQQYINDIEWLREHHDKFTIIISELPESLDQSTRIILLNNMIKVLNETVKFPDIKLYNQIIQEGSIIESKSIGEVLISLYSRIFLICGENNKYTSLTNAILNDIIGLRDIQITKEVFISILRNRNINIIKDLLLDTLPLLPSDMLFHASINPDPEVINILFDEEYFRLCRGHHHIIRKMGSKIDITEEMAGCAIYHSIDLNSENLSSLLEYFKQQNINISRAIRNYRDFEGKSALDNACLINKSEHLRILISNIKDDDLRNILMMRNYARRTLFEHAIYYDFTECINIINYELRRLAINIK
jgi:hypothetical protein